MNALISALFVIIVIGMMSASLVVDLVRYTPLPGDSPTAANAKPPAYTTPHPAPSGGTFSPPGFRGPSGPPQIIGPSSPPPGQ